MQEYAVESIDLPLTTEERKELANCGLEGIENLGKANCIKFDANKQKQTARRSIPSIANLEELKVSFVSWLKLNPGPCATTSTKSNGFKGRIFNKSA